MPVPDVLCGEMKTAAEQGAQVDIRGGGSKRFLGYPATDGARELDVTGWTGVIDYHPEELVVRVKAGTPLVDVIALLASESQMLAFEPPIYPGSTIGGTVATGLSGSRRPYTGSVRDYVLGVGLVSHDGVYQEYGGQVMKNVAGYDVSRLVCGAFGMLGVIADVSFKVLPAPEVETSRCYEIDAAAAVQQLKDLDRRMTPLSASCYTGGQLYLRFSGSAPAVDELLSELGGDPVDDGFWQQVDCRKVSALDSANELWRLSTDWLEPLADNPAYALCDWGFAQRWLADPEGDPREGYQGAGHWTCWRAGTVSPTEISRTRFDTLPAPVMALHRQLKLVFDPDRRINSGRCYPEL